MFQGGQEWFVLEDFQGGTRGPRGIFKLRLIKGLNRKGNISS